MMNPAERALLLDGARRWLNLNEEALRDLRLARAQAWDNASARARIQARIGLLEGQVALQCRMIATVEALDAGPST